MELHVPHIALGTQADAILIAPASADVVGKIANGIADDMLTTCVLPATCPVMLAPSMNVHMYENPIVQDNMKKLASYGYEIIEADEGYLACRDIGKGKLPPEHVLVDYIIRACAMDKDLAGKKVLVTAGATQESIDPVRYITNHSTGKMGYALARMAAFRGAKVTLVAGPTNLEDPLFVDMVKVVTAEDMYEAVTSRSADMDIIIKQRRLPITVRKMSAMKRSKSRMAAWLFHLQEQRIFWHILASIRRTDSLSADFLWRQSIW